MWWGLLNLSVFLPLSPEFWSWIANYFLCSSFEMCHKYFKSVYSQSSPLLLLTTSSPLTLSHIVPVLFPFSPFFLLKPYQSLEDLYLIMSPVKKKVSRCLNAVQSLHKIFKDFFFLDSSWVPHTVYSLLVIVASFAPRNVLCSLQNLILQKYSVMY